jgi:hypothetical protein
MRAQGGTDDTRRKDLVDQITIELVRHTVAEEVAVYSSRRSARRRRSAPSVSTARGTVACAVPH